jgi:hypothetical protein
MRIPKNLLTNKRLLSPQKSKRRREKKVIKSQKCLMGVLSEIKKSIPALSSRKNNYLEFYDMQKAI